MPLSNQILFSELSKFMLPETVGFRGFPENPIEFGADFSIAVDRYTASIFPPATPASRLAAKNALKFALSTVGPPPAGVLFPVAISAAMAAYATSIAAGMLPAFIAVPPIPPIGPIILSTTMPLGMSGAPGDKVISTLSQTIHSWFKTGGAVPSGGGPPITWS